MILLAYVNIKFIRFSRRCGDAAVSPSLLTIVLTQVDVREGHLRLKS